MAPLGGMSGAKRVPSVCHGHSRPIVDVNYRSAGRRQRRSGGPDISKKHARGRAGPGEASSRSDPDHLWPAPQQHHARWLLPGVREQGRAANAAARCAAGLPGPSVGRGGPQRHRLLMPYAPVAAGETGDWYGTFCGHKVRNRRRCVVEGRQRGPVPVYGGPVVADLVRSAAPIAPAPAGSRVVVRPERAGAAVRHRIGGLHRPGVGRVHGEPDARVQARAHRTLHGVRERWQQAGHRRCAACGDYQGAHLPGALHAVVAPVSPVHPHAVVARERAWGCRPRRPRARRALAQNRGQRGPPGVLGACACARTGLRAEEGAGVEWRPMGTALCARGGGGGWSSRAIAWASVSRPLSPKAHPCIQGRVQGFQVLRFTVQGMR